MTTLDKSHVENTLDDGELTLEELERIAGGKQLLILLRHNLMLEQTSF